MNSKQPALLLSAYRNTITAIGAAQFAWERALTDALEAAGHGQLSPTQAMLLYTIADGELSRTQIQTRCPGTNMTYNLEKLVKIKAVARRVPREDRRKVLYVATDKGKAVAAVVWQTMTAHLPVLQHPSAPPQAVIDATADTIRFLQRFWLGLESGGVWILPDQS